MFWQCPTTAILDIFLFQKNWPLTDEELSKLAVEIPTNTLENIAMTHLGIEREAVNNLRTRHRENIEAVNIDLLIMWRHINPETATREVILAFCSPDAFHAWSSVI